MVNRRQVPLAQLSVDLVAPLTTAYGGATGELDVTVVDPGGAPVAADAVTGEWAWSMLTPEGSAVQGWGEAVAMGPGRLHVPALQGNQDYVTWVYADWSTEPWMVKHLPVSPGCTTPVVVVLDPARHDVNYETTPPAPAPVCAGRPAPAPVPVAPPAAAPPGPPPRAAAGAPGPPPRTAPGSPPGHPGEAAPDPGPPAAPPAGQDPAPRVSLDRPAPGGAPAVPVRPAVPARLRVLSVRRVGGSLVVRVRVSLPGSTDRVQVRAVRLVGRQVTVLRTAWLHTSPRTGSADGSLLVPAAPGGRVSVGLGAGVPPRSAPPAVAVHAPS